MNHDPVILVPLDGRVDALPALSVAKVFSKLQDAPVRILHVAEHAPPVAELADRLGLEAEALHGACLESLPGEPSATILAAASRLKARLIVLCTHTAPESPADVIGATALAVHTEK